MRAGLVVALVAVVLGFGPASQAGFFPDLPGARMLEEATANKAPNVATTSGSAPDPQDRVPAPDPVPDPTAVTKSAIGSEQIEVATSMPGGGGLPIIKDVAAASPPREDVAPD